jgi:hypothetical protein
MVTTHRTGDVQAAESTKNFFVSIHLRQLRLCGSKQL